MNAKRVFLIPLPNPPAPLERGLQRGRAKPGTDSVSTSPVGATAIRQAVSTPANIGYANPRKASPVGATAIRQAVSTPASIGYANPRKASPVGAADIRQVVSTPANIGYAKPHKASPVGTTEQ